MQRLELTAFNFTKGETRQSILTFIEVGKSINKILSLACVLSNSWPRINVVLAHWKPPSCIFRQAMSMDVDSSVFFSPPTWWHPYKVLQYKSHRRSRGSDISARVVKYWNKPPGFRRYNTFCQYFQEKYWASIFPHLQMDWTLISQIPNPPPTWIPSCYACVVSFTRFHHKS